MASKRQRRDKVAATAVKGAVPAERVFSPLMRDGLIFVFFAIVVILLYSNVLNGPFTFDDDPNITENTHIRLKELTASGLWDAAFKSYAHNRPVANISFALNYYVHQYSTTGYHLINILIHLIAGILLYLFIRDSLRVWRERVSGAWAMDEAHIPLIAFSAALLWLVHPIQTQAVSYIVQRMASMASMFYLASFVLYVRGRLRERGVARYMLYAGSVTSGLLAVGSKEMAITLPFFILLYEWYFFQDLSRIWLKRIVIPLVGFILLIGIVWLVYGGVNPLEVIVSSYTNRNYTLIQRVLTEFRVVVLYISLLVFPYPGRLNLDYDFPISHSLVYPITTIFSLGVIVALVGLAIYLAKGHRVFSFCIVWFLGNLVIESSVIGIELVYEHRNYLPSMLVGLLVVLLVYRYVYMKRQWVAMGMLVVLVGVFSLWTYQRNLLWADELLLWQDCVSKSPGKARPYNNLGLVLFEQGKIDEARSQYWKALEINPGNVDAHNKLGISYVMQKKMDEAIREFSEVIRLNPEDARTHKNLGLAFLEQGNIKEAIRHCQIALKIDPSYADAYHNLGLALSAQGRRDEAIEQFKKALQINPDYAEVHYNLGTTLTAQGNLDEAIVHFRQALELNPRLDEAHNGLGVVLARKGDIEGAIREFQETLQMNPRNVGARKNLSILLNKQ